MRLNNHRQQQPTEPAPAPAPAEPARPELARTVESLLTFSDSTLPDLLEQLRRLLSTAADRGQRIGDLDQLITSNTHRIRDLRAQADEAERRITAMRAEADRLDAEATTAQQERSTLSAVQQDAAGLIEPLRTILHRLAPEELSALYRSLGYTPPNGQPTYPAEPVNGRTPHTSDSVASLAASALGQTGA